MKTLPNIPKILHIFKNKNKILSTSYSLRYEITEITVGHLNIVSDLIKPCLSDQQYL